MSLLTKEDNQRYGTLRQIEELGLAPNRKKTRRQSFQETEAAFSLHREAKTRNDNVRKYCQRLYNDKIGKL
jgi:hypothetical protein